MKKMIFGFLILISMGFSLNIGKVRAQYAFNMTPVKGPPGTYVTFTGSGFDKGKVNAFINDLKIPVIYSTRIHAVVRIPPQATSGKITLSIAGRKRKFIFPKEFKVTEKSGSIPEKTGLYISELDTDEYASKIYLYFSSNKSKRIVVHSRESNPISYRHVKAISCGDIGKSKSWEVAYCVAKKPYRKNIPVTAVLYSNDYKNLKMEPVKGKVKKIYGYVHYRNANSLTIAPFMGDSINDLIYCVSDTENKKTLFFMHISSMTRDVPLFNVPIEYKARNLCAVDFRGNNKSFLTLVYKKKKYWYLSALRNIRSFKPMVHFYRGKAEITACTKGDINSNKRQEFYFATYHKGETRIYMQYSFRGKKLLFRKKGVGKITALALSDFDNNGKKELAVAFRKNRTAAIYVSKNPNKLMADEKQKIYEKKNTVITAIASIKY